MCNECRALGGEASVKFPQSEGCRGTLFYRVNPPITFQVSLMLVVAKMAPGADPASLTTKPMNL